MELNVLEIQFFGIIASLWWHTMTKVKAIFQTERETERQLGRNIGTNDA